MRGLVSCTGIDYCHFALDRNQGARRSRRRGISSSAMPPGGKPLTMHWSGCPAGCGNHAAADIGLLGKNVRVNGEIVDAVDVFVGGRSGPEREAGHEGSRGRAVRRVAAGARAADSLPWQAIAGGETRARRRAAARSSRLPDDAHFPFTVKKSYPLACGLYASSKPADRQQLRGRHRHSDGAQRQSVRRLPVERRRVRDLPPTNSDRSEQQSTRSPSAAGRLRRAWR